MLAEKGKQLDAVIEIKVDDEDPCQRIEKRIAETCRRISGGATMRKR